MMRFWANICETPLCTENASNGSLPHCRFCSISPVHTKRQKNVAILKTKHCNRHNMRVCMLLNDVTVFEAFPFALYSYTTRVLSQVFLL